MSSAILLVAHGSRRAEANADLAKLAGMFAARFPQRIIEIGYLELTSPTIPEGLQKCVDRGADQVAILPYFLSPGAHVQEDLTKFRSEFVRQNPSVQCIVCPPIGLDKLLVDLMMKRLEQGISERLSP